MDLKLPTDHFRSSLELEELSVAQKFGIEPEAWDLKPVPERERLIGAERDLREMEVIANMPDDEKAKIGGSKGWVRVERKKT